MERPYFLVLKKLGNRKKMFEDYSRLLKAPARLEAGKGSKLQRGK